VARVGQPGGARVAAGDAARAAWFMLHLRGEEIIMKLIIASALLAVAPAMAFAADTYGGAMQGQHANKENDLQAKLADKLGKDWTVSTTGQGTILATRKEVKSADDKLSTKVNDKINDIEHSRLGVNASFSNDQIRLTGTANDCGKLVDKAEDFAKINGVNRIVFDATCHAK
jgi:hypothetical protein